MTPVPTIDSQAVEADDGGMEAFLTTVLGRLADPVLLVSVALLSLALLSGLVARVADRVELEFSTHRRPTGCGPDRTSGARR